MSDRRTILPVLFVLGCFVMFSGTNAQAATPSFTFTATNVTMSSTASSGQGSSTFTLTSINGYAGTIGVGCGNLDPPAGVKVPVCSFGGPAYPATYALAANQVVTGSVLFLNVRPPCNPCPVSLPRRGGHGLTTGLVLAGALLFGFGFRRRAPRWLTLSLLAVGALAGVVGVSACSDNNFATPGTYTYTIAAIDMSTNVTVSTSINVTVP